MGRRLEGRDLSLDGPAVGGGRPGRLESLGGDRLSQDEELSRAREGAAMRKHVSDAFEKLDARERRVVEMRLMADEPRSLREMGAHLGLSSERARQLEARAKRKLRRHLSSSGRRGPRARKRPARSIGVGPVR